MKKAYIIVKASSLIALENEVSLKLNEDYVPFGNITILPKGDNSSYYCCQSMMLRVTFRTNYL